MNRLTRHTKPDATVERYRFNKGGLPEAVSAQVRGSGDWVEFVTNINYNAKGQRTHVYSGNMTRTRYTYDQATFRLTRLKTTRKTPANVFETLQDLNYIYDPEGNIVQQTDAAIQSFYFNNTVVSGTGRYEYDALYRLVRAEGREMTGMGMTGWSDFPNNIPNPNTAPGAMQNYIHTYQYAALGNILQMKPSILLTRDYIYDTATNRLLRHEGTVNVYTYDAHGNMTAMPHLTQMLWDAKDRLLKTSLNPAQGGTADDANTTWYRYDLSGQRVRKICIKNNITEERIYLSGCEIYRRTNSGVLQTERQTLHINDDQKKIAFVETLTVADSHPLTTPESLIRYQYDNHLGSACLELDASAAIISYEEYHPFGTTSYRSGRSAAEVSLKRYKYVGKERDEESGLYYYGARYYAAWLCRFVSVDPLFEKRKNLSSYVYCSDNPIVRIDKDGKLDEVFIEGEDADSATKQLNTSSSLFISRDSITGKLSATGEAKTKKDNELLSAINDRNIDIHIITIKGSTKEIDGKVYGIPWGGGFMGNKVSTNAINCYNTSKPFNEINISWTSVSARQLVSPSILKIMDSYFDKKLGTGMFHEVIEAYEGAKISKKLNISAMDSKANKRIYTMAHDAAVKLRADQPGEVKTDKPGSYYIETGGKPRLYLK